MWTLHDVMMCYITVKYKDTNSVTSKPGCNQKWYIFKTLEERGSQEESPNDCECNGD